MTGVRTGLGKTWPACALAQYARRQEHSALYLRVPRLGEELRILHGAGTQATSLPYSLLCRVRLGAADTPGNLWTSRNGDECQRDS